MHEDINTLRRILKESRILAVDMKGNGRTLLHHAGRVEIQDVDASGRVLAALHQYQRQTFGRAAGAVRAGFLAAAAAANIKPLVIGHGDDDVLTAFNAAKEGGARVIVGPLV